MQFTIDQRIDLSMDNPMLTYRHPLVSGDDRAHLWRVRVYDRGQPESLAGCTVSCYVRREGDWRAKTEPTLYMPGQVVDGAAVAEFIPEVYALGGPLVAVMRITDGHGIATAAVLRLRADSLVTDEICDPSGSMLSVDELLAQMDTMRAVTAEAMAATQSANAAATAATASQEACDAAVTALPATVEGMFSDLGLTMQNGKLCVKVERT